MCISSTFVSFGKKMKKKKKKMCFLLPGNRHTGWCGPALACSWLPLQGGANANGLPPNSTGKYRENKGRKPKESKSFTVSPKWEAAASAAFHTRVCWSASATCLQIFAICSLIPGRTGLINNLYLQSYSHKDSLRRWFR